MQEPQLFQRKPTRLLAMRYIDSSEYDNVEALKKWTNNNFRTTGEMIQLKEDSIDASVTAFVFDYLHHTWVGVKDGDWILEGARGEFYPHDGDLFPQNYEEVTDDRTL